MTHPYKYPRYISPVTAGAMLFGALVGGAASAAGNARKVKSGEMSGRQAALDALREAGTTGLASGAGVAAMNALRVGGVAGLVGIAAVATGTKYLLDSVLAEVLAKACRACAGSVPAAQAAAEPTTAKAPAAAKAPMPAAKPRARKKPAAKPKPETYITE